jgi:hypothetical protein
MTNKTTIIRQISEQLNRMLLTKSGQAELMAHNLEKGLGNEQSLRDLLIDILPRRYGVAKGKVINSQGEMSRQLDVIIYDALNCPVLFIDENKNQIVPVEGVYGAIEVKTSLTSGLLAEAFENLFSIYSLHKRENYSKNPLITGCPPFLFIFAFSDKRTLKAIASQFVKLNNQYHVTKSCYSYSEKSPGFNELTGDSYLVCSVCVLNKGDAYHMLDGSVSIGDFGEFTLGMFLTNLIREFDNLVLPNVDLLKYLNWIMVRDWLQKEAIIRNKSVKKRPT